MDPGLDSPASAEVERMVAAWRRGERPLAEASLEALPGLDDEAAIRLIFEEWCLRQEAGLVADRDDFARRFPRWWPELELLLDCRSLMEPDPPGPDLPGPGDELAGFRLLAEIGRGASGRVFLASQLALADRPVVLKVTPAGRDEHLSLARLQHMNIVPLYSAQVLPDRRLQVLCMPDLGGASLAQVLDDLKGLAPSRRTGADLVEALDRAREGWPAGVPARGPFRRYLARSSYVEAICWVGICLADGLQYAHERRFVHMDLKPSNVLIAGDGQPMLLDFHLAREPIAAGDPPPDRLGGTPAYLAPEQARAMAAVAEGRPVPLAVDGRADLYALGLVLLEALGGEGPRADGGPPEPLHRANPAVPRGLSDIIGRCLQPRPADRHPDAAALADDLRRLLDGRPLRDTPGRDSLGRRRAWRGRRPHGPARALVVAACLVAASAATALLLAARARRADRIGSCLADARAGLDRRRYPEARRALERGLALADAWPAIGSHRPELARGLARVGRLAGAEDLHRLAERVRFRDGLDPPALEDARALARRSDAAWRDREALLGPGPGDEGPEAEAAIRVDLLDVLLARAGALARLAASAGGDEARREGLGVLDEAERLLGPSLAVALERRALAGPAGPSAEPAPRPNSARDHLDLGRSYLRSGELATAAEQFQLGLDLRPGDFWLNFDQGLCSYRLGRFDEAAAAFRVCIALAPGSAECHYNRALALGRLGRDGQAADAYTRALDLSPSLAQAAGNRGILRYRQGRLDEAATDLARALAATPGRADRGRILSNLALVDLAQGDRASALAHLDLASECGDEEARALLDRLQREPSRSPGPP